MHVCWITNEHREHRWLEVEKWYEKNEKVEPFWTENQLSKLHPSFNIWESVTTVHEQINKVTGCMDGILKLCLKRRVSISDKQHL